MKELLQGEIAFEILYVNDTDRYFSFIIFFYQEK